MLPQIIKRDRSQVPFRQEKIIFAIFKAAAALSGNLRSGCKSGRRIENNSVLIAIQRII